MIDPWASVGPSVVTSVITSVVTVAIARIVSRNAARRAAFSHPLSLHQGLGHVWRLQNDSNRKMRGVEYAIADEDGAFKVQVRSTGDLARKNYLHLEGIELGDTIGDTVLVASTARWLLTGAPLHTVQIRTRRGEFECRVREGPLTYGWGHGSR